MARALVAGISTFVVGLGTLLAGLLPPGLLATGQIDVLRWLLPFGVGTLLLIVLLHVAAGRLSGALVAVAPIVLAIPVAALWLQGSHPGMGTGGTRTLTDKVRVGVLSGPPLVGPKAPGGFDGSPLWRVLSNRAALQPLDAIESDMIESLDALLVIQPRALAPDELVALDHWVRMGGHGVLLADPDLLWDDGRSLGDPLKAPRRSQLGPLLARWGLALEEADPVEKNADPVTRRFLASGHMIQLAGASRFRKSGGHCSLSEQALVAWCRVGRGSAVLFADADFANDALWTSDSQRADRQALWTSDAPVVIEAAVARRTSPASAPRNWLKRADGLGAALRPSLVLLAIFSAATGYLVRRRRTKMEYEGAIPGLP